MFEYNRFQIVAFDRITAEVLNTSSPVSLETARRVATKLDDAEGVGVVHIVLPV